jgi:hypothetical protein
METAHQVGEPVVGDRPDTKSTPFLLRILSDDLAQSTQQSAAADGGGADEAAPVAAAALHSHYRVRPTAHALIDAVIAQDSPELCRCLEQQPPPAAAAAAAAADGTGRWDGFLAGRELGWLPLASPALGGGGGTQSEAGGAELLELFPTPVDEVGLPLRQEHERPLAALKDVKCRVVDAGGAAPCSGTLLVTDRRLIWLPARDRHSSSSSSHHHGPGGRRSSSAGSTLYTSLADLGALSIPLARVGWISNAGRHAVSFTVAQANLARAPE